MQPAFSSTAKPAFYPTPYSPHSQSDQLCAELSEDNDEAICTTLAATPMTWKQRGDYHFDRKELDLALESYTQALQKAERQNHSECIYESLKDLGRVFLEKEQWSLAAKIFNGALALLRDRSDAKSQQSILSWMVEVDRRFLEKVCEVRATADPKVYQERREKLQDFRKLVKARTEKNEPAQVIVSEFTRSIRGFLEEIIKSGYSILGQPPCAYTVMGLGSMAREEMSPYSDLEFAILVEKNSPDELVYFRKMVCWLELQIIHLGETSIKILQGGKKSPVPRGFSFDDGGNTPLGKRDYVELINTPKKLSELQAERISQEDLILSNVLRGTSFVMGEERLHREYRFAVNEQLVKKNENTGLSIGQERALKLWEGHLCAFKPHLVTRTHNIKVEFYRLPSFLIACLGDFFGVDEQNTWQRLDALHAKGKLCLEGVKNIKEALTSAMHLRISCHLHYRSECDFVYHPSMQLEKKASSPQDVYVLSDSDICKIVEMYRVLFPLQALFAQTCKDKNFANLAQEIFYNSSLIMEGEAYEKLQQHSKAEKSYRKALALAPEDPIALAKTALIITRQRESPQALNFAQQALNLGLKQNNQKALFEAYYCMGLISQRNEDMEKSIQYWEKGLSIGKLAYPDGNETIADIYGLLAILYEHFEDTRRAVACLEERLKSIKMIHGDVHSEVGSSAHRLGCLWSRMKHHQEAIRSFEEALMVTRKIRSSDAIIDEEEYDEDDHMHDLVTYLCRLADEWAQVGQIDNATRYLDEARRIGEGNLSIALEIMVVCLKNMAIGAKRHGQFDKAIAFIKEAYHIWKSASIVLKVDMSEVFFESYCDLASACIEAGNLSKAVKYLNKARKINSPCQVSLADCLNDFGIFYYSSGNCVKAIACFEEALAIYKDNEDHRRVEAVLTSLNTVKQVDKNNVKIRRYNEETFLLETELPDEKSCCCLLS